MSVLLETSMGDLVIDLYVDKVPKNCLNFLKLCKLKYYNFSLVRTVERNFMMQVTDPLGNSNGGQSVHNLLDESKPKLFIPQLHPKLKHKKKGIVSFSTVTKSTSNDLFVGSQFFITLSDDPLNYLDGQHAVFGYVAEGLDILDQINQVMVDNENRPFRDIRIKHTLILEDPFEDPRGLVVPEGSPEPTEEILKTMRIGEDEVLFPDEDQDILEKKRNQEEAAARALTLEMVGDLPFAEIKPPENCLFVCNLNPVTRDEDLELIFSRFGTIISCDIVRDRKSGDSLQYAFIEFEKREECEEAYLKMDNVLIDDRRIHVDFSQSVSKMNMGFLAGKNAYQNREFGGSTGLKRKTNYRESQSDHDSYDLIFENGGALREEQGRHANFEKSSRREDSREPKKPYLKTSRHERTSLSRSREDSPDLKRERRTAYSGHDKRREHGDRRKRSSSREHRRSEYRSRK